jgi:hypothetical protein
MTINISITYQGPINSELDEVILEMAEKNGFKFWAAGTDLETGIRDLAFDFEVTEKRRPGEANC